MGILALARHVELDEQVALKFLKPDILADDPSGTLASRFIREARATIKIRSEHVPRIFDVTTHELGMPYIVMELLIGEDLDRQLERQGPLPVAFVVDLLLQALEALAAAHALGMVHRDFKPANLFVAKRLDGSTCAKVLDFGIAKLVDRNGTGKDSGLTGTNAAMGSPRYMSPEQMRSARDVDGRADIWAVGTTLYELLTGIAPFDGESLTQVCAAILQDEPNGMTLRRPDIPMGLEAVVRRCLAKRPDDRYSNVADLANALAPFGTASVAYEMASRVARVLGTAAPTIPSTSPMALSVITLPPAPPGGSSPPTSSISGVGATHTSWGAVAPSAQASRRRAWTIASLLAVLFVSGSVLGGVALFRSRSASKAAAVAATNVASPPPIPSAPTAAPNVETPSPSASEVVAAAAPSASLAVAPPASASTPRSKPLVTSVGPKTPAPAKTPTPTKPTSPPSPPPAGGLWDDRK
jgi:eukaryotic-like serine/threonine-protein kinase